MFALCQNHFKMFNEIKSLYCQTNEGWIVMLLVSNQIAQVCFGVKTLVHVWFYLYEHSSYGPCPPFCSMEDLTDPEKVRTDTKCDRTVSLYGYLRGTHLKNRGQVHIPGMLRSPLMWKCLLYVILQKYYAMKIFCEFLLCYYLCRCRRLSGDWCELPPWPMSTARCSKEESTEREGTSALCTHGWGRRSCVWQRCCLYWPPCQPRQSEAGICPFISTTRIVVFGLVLDSLT